MTTHKNKLVFIIGMRRSGTSILRDIILKNPEVASISFEPHELMFAIANKNISRYKNLPLVVDTLEYYNKDFPGIAGYNGAKIALNPGIEAMMWQRLPKEFPQAKFIFIIRKAEHCYDSWKKIDKNHDRGICSLEMYMPWYKHITESFYNFGKQNPCSSGFVSYENFLKDADESLKEIWELLNVEQINNLNKYIREPENK